MLLPSRGEGGRRKDKVGEESYGVKKEIGSIYHLLKSTKHVIFFDQKVAEMMKCKLWTSDLDRLYCFFFHHLRTQRLHQAVKKSRLAHLEAK